MCKIALKRFKPRVCSEPIYVYNCDGGPLTGVPDGMPMGTTVRR